MAAMAFTAALAQEDNPTATKKEPPPPPLPEIEVYQRMLDDSQKAGWVQFRASEDKQVVYFTMLQVLRCQLKEVRYSINSKVLDQQVPLAPCDPRKPFSVPEDPDNRFLTLEFKPGSIKTFSVQAIWKDDTKSEIVTYWACKKEGNAACARVKSIEDAKPDSDEP